MKKNWFLVIAILVFAPFAVFAQGLSGETEVGSDGKGQGFFSQYLIYDTRHVNVLTRYFYVNGVLQRGEFALGPTAHFGKENILQFQFGGTTDKEATLAGLLIVKINGHAVVYIGDAKVATQDGPNTYFQKIFVALTKKNNWKFRAEGLQVGTRQSFLRIGAEYTHKLPDNAHLFVAPFYDPIRKAVGGQFGLRFF